MSETSEALYGNHVYKRKCRCGVLHSHPTRDECARCSGWASECGKSKTPEQATCGRRACKRRATLEAKRSVAQRRGGSEVASIAGRAAKVRRY